MADVLCRKCNIDGCKTPPILGPEEINLVEPNREYGRIYPDLGHLVLTYGQGHLDDLTAACTAAGWHCDGTQWLCPACQPAMKWVADANGWGHVEAVAHSMNV